MRVMLRRAGASTGSSLSTVTTYEDYLRQPKNIFLERQLTSHAREVANFSDGKRNALLVIAALFVTVTYQTVLSPPGGLWQDDYKPETNQTLCNTTAPLKAGSSHLGINQTHCNTTAPHKAGTAIGRANSRKNFANRCHVADKITTWQPHVSRTPTMRCAPMSVRHTCGASPQCANFLYKLDPPPPLPVRLARVSRQFRA
uniref:PGG domain-containing protein n=1 Tax=Fagus sylvatica TaxID=28930 RepID=A0A2N9GHJ7_FAGSY